MERIVVLAVWWLHIFSPGSAQYSEMVCEKQVLRNGRKMTNPGPECDMSDRNWCTVKTSNYPEKMILEVILDNRGIMKRLFGDQREARFLEDEFNSNDLTNIPPPPPLGRVRKKWGDFKESQPSNGLFSTSDFIDSKSRRGKKIDFDRPLQMKVVNNAETFEKINDDFELAAEVETPEVNNNEEHSLDENEASIRKLPLANLTERTNDKVFVPVYDDVKTQNPEKKTSKSANETPFTNSSSTLASHISAALNGTSMPVTTSTTLANTGNIGEQVTVTELTTKGKLDEKSIVLIENNSNASSQVNDTKNQVLSANHPSTSANLDDHSSTTNSMKLIGEDGDVTTPAVTEDYEPKIVSDYSKKSVSPSEGKSVVKNISSVEAKADEIKSANEFEIASTESPNKKVEGRIEFLSRYPHIPPRTRPSVQERKPVYEKRENEFAEDSTTTQPDLPRTNYEKEENVKEKENTPSKELNKPEMERKPAKMEKFQACNSTSELIAPTWAKNIQGRNLIVVNVGSFMQHLHIEECTKGALYRKMFCQRGCRCEQQYRLQKLLVVDPDDECRGIFSDWFRFPSSCVCVCYPSSFAAMSRRDGRIIEDDDFLEEEYDDLDDPLVRYYYGLDLDEDADLKSTDINVDPQSHSVDELLLDHPVEESNDEALIEGRSSMNNHGIIARSDIAQAKPNNLQLNRGNPSQNSTRMMASRSMKSRLMKGFENTGNKRARMMPVRFSSKTSLPSSVLPWLKSRSLSFWPSIALIHHVNSKPVPNSLSSNLFENVYPPTPLKNRKGSRKALDVF